MQVMQNNGTAALAAGDVVVFSGLDREMGVLDAPIVQVSKVNGANSTAVAGVVFSRFNMDAVAPINEPMADGAQAKWESPEVTPAGAAEPGEYVLVVVQGPAQVNVGALGRDIRPGDLLATSGLAGLAGKAAMVSFDGVETAVPGTVFGKALETPTVEQEMIYVYVTLH